MPLLVSIIEGKVFVQPVGEDPDVSVDLFEEEVKPGEKFGSFTYDDLLKHGNGIIT